MPQMPMGPGAPSDVGPDGGLVDPGMVGPDGAPADGDGPPHGDSEPGDGPFEGPGDDSGTEPPPGDDDDSGPPPPPKGKSKKKSSLRYRGTAGQQLNEEQLVRHMAVAASGADPRVMARLRAEGAKKRVTANARPYRTLSSGHQVSIGRTGRDWYGTITHPASSQIHLMHLGQDGDPRQEAERQLARDPARSFVHATTPDRGGEGMPERESPNQWWNTPNQVFRDTPFHSASRTAARGEEEKTARGHYQRGWNAGQRAVNGVYDYGPSPLEKADTRGEPKQWYDGYHDYTADRPKYHALECTTTGDHDQPGCSLYGKFASRSASRRPFAAAPTGR
jgi:hypothetical protein